MKSKIIYCCLFCGIRIGATKSALCSVDAKLHGIELAFVRRKSHVFQWTRYVEGWYGKGIGDEIAELSKEGK